jgi:hypothetical protein
LGLLLGLLSLEPELLMERCSAVIRQLPEVGLEMMSAQVRLEPLVFHRVLKWA